MAQYRFSSPWSGSPGALGDLRQRLDEFFEELRGEGVGSSSARVYPAVNLYESSEGYVLSAELPGLRREDIEVSVEGDRVNLRGERRIEHPRDASLHRSERGCGAFRRTIQLPAEVDVEKVQAAYRNGVLMLHMPKAPQHQARRIAVTS